VGYESPLNSVVTSAKTINNSYAAAYWPWLKLPANGFALWCPASTHIPSVFAFNDAAAYPWFAPAGTSRGVMNNIFNIERTLTKTNRDTLYQDNINPIAKFPGVGITVFGQKTLQKKSLATNRINVRRLLIELKTQIGNFADNLVFEQNTAATRNDFLGQVNPLLASIQQRQGLEDFRVIMDDTNNTPTTIDNNELIGSIFIKPTKTAEFITLNFNITPTGVDFT